MSFESEPSFPFGVLGIDDPDAATRKEVKRAYARRLKSIDQAKDAEAFQELRGALEFALQIVELREGAPDLAAETGPSENAAVGDEPSGEGGAGAAAADMSGEGGVPPDAEVSVGQIAAAIALDNKLALEDSLPAEMRDRLAELEGLAPSHTAIRKFSELLDDPDFTEFEANRLLGMEIAGFLERAVEWREGGTPYFVPEVRKDFLNKLDDRYHWLTDYRALEPFTYEPDVLHAAMFLTVNGLPAAGQEAGNDKMAPIDSTLGICVLVSFFGSILVRVLDRGSLEQVIVDRIVTVAVVIVFAILAFKIAGKLLGPLYQRARGFFSRF